MTCQRPGPDLLRARVSPGSSPSRPLSVRPSLLAAGCEAPTEAVVSRARGLSSQASGGLCLTRSSPLPKVTGQSPGPYPRRSRCSGPPCRAKHDGSRDTLGRREPDGPCGLFSAPHGAACLRPLPGPSGHQAACASRRCQRRDVVWPTVRRTARSPGNQLPERHVYLGEGCARPDHLGFRRLQSGPGRPADGPQRSVPCREGKVRCFPPGRSPPPAAENASPMEPTAGVVVLSPGAARAALRTFRSRRWLQKTGVGLGLRNAAIRTQRPVPVSLTSVPGRGGLATSGPEGLR